MARPRKNGTIEDEILKQEDTVAKARTRYDQEVKRLKDLYAKRDEMKQKELMKAIEKSNKSYEEIIAFLNE